MERRNFARGEPPPQHSWEWAGTPTPPAAAGKAPAKQPEVKKGIPFVLAVSETIVVARKKKSWLGLLVAGAGGFLLGYGTGKRR